MTIAFEGPASAGGPQPQPPGTYSVINQYSEQGMRFTVPGHPDGLLLVGSGLLQFFLGNCTRGEEALEPREIARGEFQYARAGDQVRVGYRQDGTTATNLFAPRTGSVQDFRNFQFASGFTDLARIELSGGWAIDNFLVSIPEPQTGGLVLLGALGAIATWRRRRRQP